MNVCAKVVLTEMGINQVKRRRVMKILHYKRGRFFLLRLKLIESSQVALFKKKGRESRKELKKHAKMENVTLQTCWGQVSGRCCRKLASLNP